MLVSSFLECLETTNTIRAPEDIVAEFTQIVLLLTIISNGTHKSISRTNVFGKSSIDLNEIFVQTWVLSKRRSTKRFGEDFNGRSFVRQQVVRLSLTVEAAQSIRPVPTKELRDFLRFPVVFVEHRSLISIF